jgi:RNA polymerase sigma-70 factor (ECF subfamily)
MLAVWSRDIAGAEDALAEAFASALNTWPARGVPSKPDAWLLTAARNQLRNTYRHGKIEAAAQQEIERRMATSATQDSEAFGDDRLKLLFVCAHPAIDPAVRTPLMLQTVLGLDAARIASAFLVAPSSMGQRLVRAKAKIRDSGIRFEVPSGEDLPDRLGDVLNAVYAAYGAGWDSLPGDAPGAQDLVKEAIFLGRLLVSLMPDEPEARGLLALMLYCEARRAARRDRSGRFVPLSDQDAGLWSRDMIGEAESLLTSAAKSARFGRFQCEAAIQSAHVQRAVTGLAQHAAVRILYDLLATHAPGLGALVGRAAAALDAGDPDRALQCLDDLHAPATGTYQPYWVTRAHAMRAKGRFDEARHNLETAIGLTEDEAVREYLVELQRRWSDGAATHASCG